MQPVQDHVEKHHTLNRRYVYKLSSNVISIFTGICTAAIVPRALGVNSYGVFSFVNNVITQILTFLDMRSSTCFYVKLSQRQSESRIITFYGLYTILVFIVLTIAVAVVVLLPRDLIFERIDNSIIWFALIFVSIRWIADIFIKISDAYGTTVIVEKIKIVNQLLGLVLLVLLFYFDFININTFYLHQIFVFGLLAALIYRFFRRNKYAVPLAASMDKNEVSNYAREFYAYSSPLVVFLAVTLVTEIFDRYLLQYYGGSYQQGLYGFSFAISSMTILFVTAMVPLFTRELSIAFSTNNVPLAAALYRKYVPTMYVISAYFCCFLFINADSVIMIFGGEQYQESLAPLKIMLLYPLISTYSNLNGSVMYAKSSTTLIRNLTLALAPIGMISTFILVSTDFVDLGATGLAFKVFGLEIISVFVMMLYISKYLNLNVTRYFLHMLFAPVILLLMAYGIRVVILRLLPATDSTLLIFVASGVVYTIVFGLIFYFFPIFVGLTKDNIQNLQNKIIQNLSSKFR